MGQDNTATKSPSAQAGQAGSTSATRSHKLTKRAELDQAIIPGIFVVKGTANDEVKLPAGAGGLVKGIVTLTADRRKNFETGLILPYGQGEDLTVAKEQDWYVITEEAVTEGGTVYMRHTAGAGGTQLGAARTDADTATAEAVKAKFAETKTSAGVAKVDLLIDQV